MTGRRRTIGILMAAALPLAPDALAQAPGASLSGQVVSADAAAQPVRRAVVTLAGDGLPGGRTAVSDGDGRFVFDELPAGRFTLTARKPGFLDGVYGATRAGGAGIPLQIDAGQRVTDASVRLIRGAVLTGTVRDPSGAPIPGLDVGAFERPRPGAPAMLTMTASARTDDRGVYRIHGLAPGDYYLSAVQRSGRLVDVATYPASAIDAMLASLRRGTSAAEAAGATAAPEAAPETYAYAPVFYPGTPAPDEAPTVTLGPAEERTGLDFVVALTRMATVEGVLIDNGIATRPLIINRSGARLSATTGSAPLYFQEPTPTGLSFRYTNVVPGRYTIVAQSSETGRAFARAEVVVTGDDVTGVTLVMQPALRLTGRVVFDGATEPPASPEAVSMRLRAVDGAGQGSVGYTRIGSAVIPPPRIRPDWTFEFGGLLPDAYHLAASVTASDGWWPRSAVVDGVDILDRPLEMRDRDVSDAVVTFTDRRTHLSGTVLTIDEAPAPAYFIVLFPEDRTLWEPGARRVRSARTGTDGRWVLENLPPGRYLLAALEDLGQEALDDAGTLADLAAAAIPLELGEGERRTQDIQIRREPR